MKHYHYLIASLIVATSLSCSSSDGGSPDEPPVNPPTGDNTGTTPSTGDDDGDYLGKVSVSIKGEHVKVIQDLTRGGAICHISEDGGTSIVNVADEGRYIQQSYYAGNHVDRCSEGQGESWSPWNWNPIQVGDYKRHRATIIAATKTGNTTYVKCIPMLWDMDNKPAEATMEQWTTLEGNTIHVKCRLTCNRTDDIYGEGISHSQEIPAVYPISSLSKLYAYRGEAPFTGAPVSQIDVVQLTANPNGGGGVWGYYSDIAEKWMAFVNTDNHGLGVYSPSATLFAAGRSDANTNGTATSASTSYIAPLRSEALMKNSTMEYEYYLVVDDLDAIRTRIYDLHATN